MSLINRIKNSFTKDYNKNDRITLTTVLEAFKNSMPHKINTANLTIKDVKKTICDYYNITNEQLVGNSRVSNLTTPRFIAIYLCRKLIQGITYEEIGEEFGNRDHSTIINACIKIEAKINEDQAYKLIIDKFQQMLTK